jgi:hypothetical protein
VLYQMARDGQTEAGNTAGHDGANG